MSITATRPALKFTDLSVTFLTGAGDVDAVKGISLEVRPGEVVAVVGESGSGKSVTSLAAMGLLAENAITRGSITVGDTEVMGLPNDRLRKLRASEIAMIFQEPMTALNPVLTIQAQLTEIFELHDVAYGDDARDRSIELLRLVGIPEPEKRIRQYPHQFSGGQRQRIVIAMAVALDPKVIIADEPTTALDVTVQAEILDLLRRLKDDRDAGILLITHNMGVVADIADRVAVMYRGDLVEVGAVEDVLTRPQHPYTKKLLAAVPKLDPALTARAQTEASREVVLEAKGLVLEYAGRGRTFRAVEDVSFVLAAGEVLGIVGESGSGKSTIARAVLGLMPVAGGTLELGGRSLSKLRGREGKRVRRDIGVVFQDPAASLDPRFPIGDCIIEPMVIHREGTKAERLDRARELLEAVRLPGDVLERYPHELSGGQRQRVSIARALMLRPKLFVADEPTSALDVSVQAAVLDMLKELQETYAFACILVSHDLAVVDQLSDHILVLKSGRTVEQGPTSQVLMQPREAYTRELLAASPVPDPIEQRRRREERRAAFDAS